jgi:hypothetical protein
MLIDKLLIFGVIVFDVLLIVMGFHCFNVELNPALNNVTALIGCMHIGRQAAQWLGALVC